MECVCVCVCLLIKHRKNVNMHCSFFITDSILDESGDNIGLVAANESTIKLENPSGSGAAALAAYYCNSYPLTTSSPGLVTAVTTADRNNSMLVTGTYSNYSLKRIT